MRAAVFHETGPAEVLTIAEVPIPAIGPLDVLVRIHAAAVQPFDVAVRSGRWSPPNMEPRWPVITGNEFAGVVAALGEEVAGFAVGDRVAGRHSFGCAAEYLAVPAGDIARIAPNLDFAQAAYLGGTGQTAHMAVEFLELRQGDTFLIHGGAGGVGSIAVQLGLQAGARVIAIGSADNQAYLRSLGAEPLVYGEGLHERIMATAPEGVSVVLDCAGGEALDISIALGTDKNRIATIGDQRYRELGVRWPSGPRDGARLRKLMALASDGRLHVHIRRTYPFERIADAHRDVEQGHGPGKVAVIIPQPAPAHVGRPAIAEYWRRSLGQQRDTEVHVGEPLLSGRRAAVEWWAALTEDGEAASYSGTLFLTFDEDGLCRSLREVWTREPGHQRPYKGWGRWEMGR